MSLKDPYKCSPSSQHKHMLATVPFGLGACHYKTTQVDGIPCLNQRQAVTARKVSVMTIQELGTVWHGTTSLERLRVTGRVRNR